MKKVGDKIDTNEPWLKVYHNNDDFEQNFQKILNDSIEIQSETLEAEALVIKIKDLD